MSGGLIGTIRQKQSGAVAINAPPIEKSARPPLDLTFDSYFGLETHDLGHGIRVAGAWVDESLATKILEYNRNNRPISDPHVKRISGQFCDDRWKINGATVVLGKNGDVFNGQHRLWGIIMAKARVFLILVFGVDRESFATMDTIQKPRSGSDTMAVNGLEHHRKETSSALAWLIRYQRGAIVEHRSPAYRVENSHIEEAYAMHPDVVRAVEEVKHLRRVVQPALLGMVYYLLCSHDAKLAERMVKTLEDPAGVAFDDPFYALRSHLTSQQPGHRDPVMTLAVMIKAVNAAHEQRRGDVIRWRSQGKNPEAFPTFWWLRQ